MPVLSALEDEVTTKGLRLLSIKEACRTLGVGRTTLYGEMANGRLLSVTIGRRRFVPREAIEKFVAALPTAYRRSA